MRRGLASAVSVAFAVASIGAVTHAVAERSERRDNTTTLAALASSLSAVGGGGSATRKVHVVINGASSALSFDTVGAPLSKAAEETAARCGESDGDEARPVGEQSMPVMVREAVRRDDADGVSAVLCVFRVDGQRRERYTLLKRVDDKTTSRVVIARKSAMDLEVMFPRDRDAPGDDPAVRPARSRRAFVAKVIETGHAVWTYESEDDRESAAKALDAAMRVAGFATAVTTDEGGRLYTSTRANYVVTFEPSGAGTRITMARPAD